MIKFMAEKQDGGTLYGFGLTEANLNRMEFNSEPIFFDFGYAGLPALFGLIIYMGEFERPEDITQLAVEQACLPFVNAEMGVAYDTLRVFPISRSSIEKLRATPFLGLDTYAQIARPNDMQLFFAGPDELAIERYFAQAGFITPKTKRTYKGFGKGGDRA